MPIPSFSVASSVVAKSIENWWARLRAQALAHAKWGPLAGAGVVVLAVLVWQGLTASGNPNPAGAHLTPAAAVLDTGVLVFREGLECILVLSAITASMMGSAQRLRRPIGVGAGLGFVACIVTWFAVVGILNSLSNALPALDVQAATGLLAVLVLVVIMNWFFHKIYWTGWISMHNRHKRALVAEAERREAGAGRSVVSGLILLGFASVYREGVEVVLFLQTLRLQVGSGLVLLGVLVGLTLTLFVGAITVAAHHRLPYKKMLILTGVLLGAVFLVMVGEQAQEMQLAGWIPTTTLPLPIPGWMGLWFSIFPTVQTLAAQILAAVVVIGSYLLAQETRIWRLVRQRLRSVATTSSPARESEEAALHVSQ